MSFVLCASPLSFAAFGGRGGLEPWDTGAPRVWLALDELTDPQNFGALVRTAVFLGAGVLCSSKNSAPLSAAVSKASSGAAEEADVFEVRNLAAFLEASRGNGWRVLGAAKADGAAPLESLAAGDATPPTVVVLGSEGSGLRTTVARACDGLVVIGGADGGDSDVDSLNVSVAGAILLHHFLKRAS